MRPSASQRLSIVARASALLEPHEWLLLGVLAVVGAGPVAVLAASANGDTLTGATGLFPGDQLQYLAWITSLAHHPLAASNFDLGRHEHVFLGPVFMISSLVVRAGGSPQLGYLLWLPVATGALLLAYRSFVNSSLEKRSDRACALCLALFALTPLVALADWAGLLGPQARGSFAVVANDSTPALQLWGYLPTAIVLALCVLTLGIAERILAAERLPLGLAAVCAGTAFLASWTHPWQGLVLIVTLAGLGALGKGGRRGVLLVLPIVAAGLPLVYYHVLPKLDSAWEAASAQTGLESGFEGLATLATVAPLLVAALPALLRRPHTLRGRTLRIWPLATLMTWWLGPPFPSHVLETLSLPLAILVVEGWRSLPRRGLMLGAFTAVMVVPGAIWVSQTLYRQASDHRGAYLVRSPDREALSYLRSSSPVGGVLAPFEISMAVPEFTDRPTWIGHPVWTPGFVLRVDQAKRLFGGRVTDAGVARFVRYLKVRTVLAPCGTSPRLARQIEPLAERTRRFGCATVYVLSR